jgi:hypothetical protein
VRGRELKGRRVEGKKRVGGKKRTGGKKKVGGKEMRKLDDK